MNRRGDLAFTLLGLFALIAAGAALFTFVSFTQRFDTVSYQYSSLITQIDFAEEYIMQEAALAGSAALSSGGDPMSEFQRIVEERNYRIEQFGTFSGKVRAGEFTFTPVPEGYLLSVEEVTVSAERGENSIKRVFDLRIELHV
ncbi:hypothetical protein HYZ97_03740 [Candidatus Pacearchaeota archaeon]|nr:hypothetical protein [Candidatus Pacearchaeota archaeon]